MKYIFITGGASGIGRALVEDLSLDKNNIIFAADINKEALKEFKQINIVALYVDITDVKSITNAYNKILTYTDKLDVIINNAGISFVDSLIEGDTQDFKKMMDINLFGMVNVNKVLFPAMNKKTRIINISSECGYMTVFPFNGPYTISKYAVEAYTDALRRELMFLGIKVIKIQPGSFKTPLHQNVMDNFKKIIDRTTHYKKILTKMAASSKKSMDDYSDMYYLIYAVRDAIESENPKINYRVKVSSQRAFLSKLPETMVDNILYKNLK